jgi:UDP-glucose 4-epimerase
MENLKPYNNKRVLVTGAAGYIGSALIDRLSVLGAEVIAFSRKPIFIKGVKNVLGDIRNKDGWKDWVSDVPIIFHLAAQTNDKVAAKNPMLDWENNCGSFLNLLRACGAAGNVPTVILASSVTLFGRPDKLPVRDSIPATPLSYYDLHKLCNETYLTLAQERGCVRGTSLRLANVYGPSSSVSAEGRGILNWMVGQALQHGKLTVYGTGEWIRDYIFIDDVVDAFLRMGVADPSAFNTASYQVCSGKGTRFLDVVRHLADLVQKHLGRSVSVSHDHSVKLSVIDQRNFIGDPSKLIEKTGWESTISLEAGMQRILDVAIKGANYGMR